MKLYIWNQPYHIPYGSSVLYAIAETEDEARALAQKAGTSEYGYDPSAKNQLPADLGPPTRVHDLPYAEVYEWSE